MIAAHGSASVDRSDRLRSVVGRAGLPLFFAVLAIFFIVTISDDETWSGGDFSLYLMHAANIAAFKPFSLTHFIYNPLNNIMSPSAYPPLYPIVLSLVYRILGLDLYYYKVESCMISAVWIYSFYAIARGQRFTKIGAVVLSAAVALSPAVFIRHDFILSDITFSLVCVAGLLLQIAIVRSGASPIRLVALLGCLIMAMETRTVGIALPAAIILTVVIRRPAAWRVMVLTAITGVIVSGLINHLVKSDAATYESYFKVYAQRGVWALVVESGASYIRMMEETLGADFHPAANLFLTLLFVAGVIHGFLRRALFSFGPVEAFFITYFSVVFIFPLRYEVVRYNLPIIPFMFMYFFASLHWLAARIGGARGATTIGAMLFLLCFSSFYWQRDLLSPKPFAVTDSTSREMFQAVREIVSPNEIVLARNPRVLALFTDRFATNWPEAPEEASFWAYAREIKARYLLRETALVTPDKARVDRIVDSRPERFEPLFSNRWFVLYRIVP